LTKLLSEMGASLGYDFDEVTYRKGAYVPQPYFSIDEENTFIRQQFVRVLRGEAALPMRMVSTVDDQTASQKATEQLVGIMVEAMAEKFGPPAHESEGEDSGSDASAPKN
jgi:hypothetical protein